MKAVLFAILFSSCYLFAESKPSWVDNRPVSEKYYIGIGFAQKSSTGQDYRQVGKDEALRDLASEITVNISGEFIHSIAEQSGMIEEDVRSQVRSSTEANLEGYELVDNWEDEDEYWVYYRLSKSHYENLKRQKLNKATSLSLDLFSKGKVAEQENDFAKALIFYTQALNPIQDYVSEPLKVEFQGSQIYLMNNIYSSAQDLLSRIELKAVNANLKGKTGQALSDPLAITAAINKSDGSNKAVANLPLEFEFIRGGGSLIDKALTDVVGNASSRISKIQAIDKMQIVQCKVDLISSLGESSSLIIKNMVNRFAVPSTKFVLTISGMTAFLEVSEKHLSADNQILYVEPKLKNALTNYGFSFSQDISKADVVIKLEANARKGTEMHNLFVTWVDMNFSVLDMSTGQEVYKNSFPDIKGIQLDYEKAAVKAFENAAKKVEEVLPQIMKKIQK